MFEKEIFDLCNKRSVFINAAHITQFIATTQELGILAHGGIFMTAGQPDNPLPCASQCMYLDKPITREEACYIATYKELKGSFDYLIAHGHTPFRALAELNLL